MNVYFSQDDNIPENLRRLNMNIDLFRWEPFRVVSIESGGARDVVCKPERSESCDFLSSDFPVLVHEEMLCRVRHCRRVTDAYVAEIFQ